MLVCIGGALLAVPPFLTWLNVALLGSLNLFQVLSGSHRSAALAWLAVGTGGTAALIAYISEDLQNTVRAIALSAVLDGRREGPRRPRPFRVTAKPLCLPGEHRIPSLTSFEPDGRPPCASAV